MTTMDKAAVVQALFHHYGSLFPRNCTKCNRHFASLQEYILATERLGSVQSFDIQMGNWRPSEPIGSLALSNCSCGTTLALSTDGLPLSTGHAILDWVKSESERRKVKPTVLLDEVREEVRVLATTSSS